VIVAIASGKGGTGKTTVAVNLAVTVQAPVQLLDCDVEAANAHLFLRPDVTSSVSAGIPVPRLDGGRCTLCGECGALCQYNAIAVLRTGVMVFEELCHGCGGCALVCPEQAIREELRPIGVVERGRARAIEVVTGRLNVGEALAPPLIRAVKADASSDRLVLVDAPPGTSCPMIAAVQGSDLVVLVTEPTPFALSDLGLAVEAVRSLGLPFGVVVNRVGSGDLGVRDYCVAEGIEILAEIPDDRRAAESLAPGAVIVDELEHVRPVFAALARRIEARLDELGACTASGRVNHAPA
jgi:MinD superfamily P-loop ATPase